jgi:hypothetical protein
MQTGRTALPAQSSLGANSTVLQDIMRTQQRILNDMQQIKARQTLCDERVTALQEELREFKPHRSFRGMN